MAKQIIQLSPKKEEAKLVIKGTTKVAIGHQQHISGCGRHDNRPKRLRTRSATIREALKD